MSEPSGASQAPYAPFTAIVLAGDRRPGDEVAAAAGVPAKCLAPVGGQAMALRVLQALADSTQVGPRVLVGPRAEAWASHAGLRAQIEAGTVDWLPPQASPSAAALAALERLPSSNPVLITTADHALLTAALIDYFCVRAQGAGSDAVAGVVRHEMVTGAFPDMHRTAFQFRDGAFCGCNLFALLTPRGREIVRFWRDAETHRKRPWHLARLLGAQFLLRYLLGQLTLAEAVDRLGQRTGTQLTPIELEEPAAAVDIDQAQHWLALREQHLSSLLG